MIYSGRGSPGCWQIAPQRMAPEPGHVSYFPPAGRPCQSFVSDPIPGSAELMHVTDIYRKVRQVYSLPLNNKDTKLM